MLVIQVYTPPSAGLWLRELFDAAHVFAFGIVSLCIYAALQPALGVWRRAACSLAASLVVGVLSEAAQIPIARDASWHDLVSDWSGSAAALSLLVAFSASRDLTLARRILLPLLALTLLSVALWPLGRTSVAYLERYRQLPALVSFDAVSHELFWRRQHARTAIRDAPAGAALEVSLASGAWPGITFHDLWPDWRGHAALVIDLTVPGDSDLNLNIRVHDRAHETGNRHFSDRYNRQLQLAPGDHVVRIPLKDIAAAPRHREMDLEHMSAIILFGDQQAAGRVFIVNGMRLVP